MDPESASLSLLVSFLPVWIRRPTSALRGRPWSGAGVAVEIAAAQGGSW
ncbi:hypothetical protein KXD97_11385 [Mycobacterium sp. SMC-8]|nr:hypothetical protein [Mycobacterium sp. SMC-8]UXA14325.1 hypothetical protein KXD97_11385 [Mycobacterium sp. SMC-8]